MSKKKSETQQMIELLDRTVRVAERWVAIEQQRVNDTAKLSAVLAKNMLALGQVMKRSEQRS